MTIKQLRSLLKGLPADMEVFIDDGNMLSPVCSESGDIASIAIGETIIPTDILIISPCVCEVEENEEAFNLN